MKKFLILVLSLAMVFTMAAFPAYAEENAAPEGQIMTGQSLGLDEPVFKGPEIIKKDAAEAQRERTEPEQIYNLSELQKSESVPITLTVDENGMLSWTEVEGATAYVIGLQGEPWGDGVDPDENGTFNINQKIDWWIRTGEITKPSDDIYELVLDAIREEDDSGMVIGTGTLEYHYVSDAEYYEPVDISFTVENGILSWTPVEGTDHYLIWISESYGTWLDDDDNGVFNIDSEIDRRIREGTLTKPEDGEYTLILEAQDEEDFTLGEGEMTYKYDSDAVYVEPAKMTLNVDNGLLSWTPVEGASVYNLFINDDIGFRLDEAENGSYNINEEIDRSIKRGYIHKPSNGIYELVMEALDGDDIAIGVGSLTYEYETDAVYEEPVEFTLKVENGLLSWTPVEDAEWYQLYVNDYWVVWVGTDENGSYDINGAIDHLIKTGEITKSADGNYELLLVAHDENGDEIGFGTLTYHYETDAEYIEVVEMTAWIDDDGILHWNAVEGAACYDCGIQGVFREAEGLSFDLKSFADTLYTEGVITDQGTYYVNLYAYNNEDYTVGEWEGSFEYVPKTVEIPVIKEIDISDVFTDLKAGEKIKFTTKIGTEDVDISYQFWSSDSGEYVYEDSDYTPKKGEVLSYTIMVGTDWGKKFDEDDNLVIKYTGTQVHAKIGRMSDRYLNIWGLIPPVMIGNDPADKVERLAGNNRFQTAFLTADRLMKRFETYYGNSKFRNAVIASGINFPDALAGAYLAGQKGAPLLLASAAEATNVAEYIKKNMEEDGTVYILGGEVAVPADMEAALTKAGVKNVKRLKGDNRYLTNLEILKEAGVDYQDLLVCSGGGYADSLSASATGRPVLLVGNKLLPEQKEYLESIKDKFSGNVYAIGGDKVVTNDVFKEVCAYAKGEKERLAGQNRYLTSEAVAEKFFDYMHTHVVLAYAQNYPDGLAGGPLAYYINAPLLLVDTNHIDAAKAYAAAHGVRKCIVLGGPGLISDQAALTIVS